MTTLVISRLLSAKAESCQSDAAFKLRDAVTSQSEARTVVLELTEVHALEGGGLGMLIFLQRWARDHGSSRIFGQTGQCLPLFFLLYMDGDGDGLIFSM